MENNLRLIGSWHFLRRCSEFDVSIYLKLTLPDTKDQLLNLDATSQNKIIHAANQLDIAYRASF